jgi:AraC family transcriptional regulator
MEAIDHILHYIERHFDKELPLQTLADQAHYSAYHFHRLFKQQVGEAPKQYLLRLRLEKATKELIFFPDKSVYAIAIDAGFSSHPVFARAFRNKYGFTAEQYRKQAMKVIRERTEIISPDVQQYAVTVRRIERFTIACELTLLGQEENIMQAFRRLQGWAGARELSGRHPEYYGVFLDSPFTTSLEKCRYLAAIRIHQAAAGKECRELGGMTVAEIPVMGNYDVLTNYALYVKQRWIPDSGYEIIPGVSGFEAFPEIHFQKPYAQQFRTICIGMQPK